MSTRLIQLCKKNDINKEKFLTLLQTEDINALDNRRRTALYYLYSSKCNDKYSLVKLMVKTKKLHIHGKHNILPLINNVTCDQDVKIIRLLINKPTDKQTLTDNLTALIVRNICKPHSVHTIDMLNCLSTRFNLPICDITNNIFGIVSNLKNLLNEYLIDYLILLFQNRAITWGGTGYDVSHIFKQLLMSSKKVNDRILLEKLIDVLINGYIGFAINFDDLISDDTNRYSYDILDYTLYKLHSNKKLYFATNCKQLKYIPYDKCPMFLELLIYNRTLQQSQIVDPNYSKRYGVLRKLCNSDIIFMSRLENNIITTLLLCSRKYRMVNVIKYIVLPLLGNTM